MQYEISKLRYQVQQILISQRATKDDLDGLKVDIEANVDVLKDEMKANIDDQEVEFHIKHQKQVLQLLKDNLTLVQNRMKQKEDQHHSERSSEEITETRTRKLRNRSISEYLIKWKNFPLKILHGRMRILHRSICNYSRLRTTLF